MKLLFTFTRERALAETLKVPLPPGQLVDATCVFSDTAAWLLTTIKSGSELRNYCFLFDNLCNLRAQTSTLANDGSWLGELRGKCAIGSSMLLAPTDTGINQVVSASGNIGVSKTFPDTEPFVDSHSQLFVVKDGIAVVGRRSINILQIK